MQVQPALQLFYCYAREDRIYRDELDKSLSHLKRQKLLMTWHDREIKAGEDWKSIIDSRLQQAHIIICLVSRDFLASDYCYEQEMQQALKRHREGTARVIPILIRATPWEKTPFSELQMLPSDACAVASWSNHDEAWLNVVNGIELVIQELFDTLQTKAAPLVESKKHRQNGKSKEEWLAESEGHIQNGKSKEAWLAEGEKHIKSGQYKEGLNAYEHVIQLDPASSHAFETKSLVLNYLGRYEEALAAAERAIQLNPTSSYAFELKSLSLNNLERYAEALTAARRALRLDPTNSYAQEMQSMALGYLNPQ
ncbi:MAG TPA: TIR domain-containing protein [Ktedonobacteraceae bacterium]|nr:TIR domain-containing protein [Ktedonobacteraceae bacterium]